LLELNITVVIAAQHGFLVDTRQLLQNVTFTRRDSNCHIAAILKSNNVLVASPPTFG
jgi:hypothetical protein